MNSTPYSTMFFFLRWPTMRGTTRTIPEQGAVNSCASRSISSGYDVPGCLFRCTPSPSTVKCTPTISGAASATTALMYVRKGSLVHSGSLVHPSCSAAVAFQNSVFSIITAVIDSRFASRTKYTSRAAQFSSRSTSARIFCRRSVGVGCAADAAAVSVAEEEEEAEAEAEV